MKLSTKGIKRMKKKVIWISLGVVALLAIAYVAGRYLTGEVNPLNMLQSASGDLVMTSIQMEPSKDLPQERDIAAGTYSGRADNIIHVKEIAVSVVNGVGYAGGDDANSVMHDVLVTKETKIFQDVTDYSTAGQGVTQQVVEPSDLEEMSEDAFVQVWGRNSGDRVIADTICFSNPTMIGK
jgi:hypothetical protein